MSSVTIKSSITTTSSAVIVPLELISPLAVMCCKNLVDVAVVAIFAAPPT